MAKALITTQEGIKVTIEGTPEEVANVVARLSGDSNHVSAKRSVRSPSRPSAGPINLVAEFIEAGFFKKPKELATIKSALAEQGHFYPVTTLSPTLLRLVRKRLLRRIKENKRWLYVG